MTRDKPRAKESWDTTDRERNTGSTQSTWFLIRPYAIAKMGEMGRERADKSGPTKEEKYNGKKAKKRDGEDGRTRPFGLHYCSPSSVAFIVIKLQQCCNHQMKAVKAASLFIIYERQKKEKGEVYFGL